MTTDDAELELDGRRLRLTSLDRVLWPATGFTKGAMIDYYRAVAPVLLPHLSGRPLTLGRWPQGVEARGFAQMECRGHPAWMRTAPLPLRTGEIRNFCVVDDSASLVWVANLGTIELHTYQFAPERPDEPTALALDLDPGPGAGLLGACRVALLLRASLAARGLAGWAKTSGASGLHIYVPLGSPHANERVRTFARQLAEELSAAHGSTITNDARAGARRGKVLVDWLQSDPRRSTVAPYSLRATDRPAVSTPLAWDELERVVNGGDASTLRFGPMEVLERISRHGDLFRAVLETEQELPA